jgi:hypothetical protein
MDKKISSIPIKSHSIVRVLALIGIFLVCASVAGQLFKYLLGHDYVKGFVPLFYIDNENNIPTFFSVFLLLVASMLLTAITMLHFRQSSRYVRYWAILSLGFLLMAYDEGAMIHERLIEPIRELLFPDKASIFFFAWVIPGMILVLILGILFLKFVINIPAPSRKRFLISAALYLGGSIGFELIGGWYTENVGTGNLAYTMIVTVEEGLEMAGAITFIWALLQYLSEYYKEVNIRFL